MTIESQREQLLTELDATELLYNGARQMADWDTAKAQAEKVRSLCRRLELLELQDGEKRKFLNDCYARI